MTTEQHAQAAPQFCQIARITRTFLDAGEDSRGIFAAGPTVNNAANQR